MSEKSENVERAKVLLQNFMDSILQDDIVSSSELVYAFFSPSPDHLKISHEEEKTTKFKKLTSLFKNDQSKKSKDDLTLDELRLMEEFFEKSLDLKDDIAEPLYSLISEIFDLKGVSKWFRKSLVTFVQISFGRTISRHLQETSSWLVSESMIVTYLNMFKNSIWINGQLRPEAAPRTAEEKDQARKEAKELFLSEVPRTMVKIVGLQTAVQGTEKIFDSFQEKTLNKHLVYTLMECLVGQLVPELISVRASLQSKQ